MYRAKAGLVLAGITIAVVAGPAGEVRAERPKYRVRAIEPYPGTHVVWARPEALNNANVAVGDSAGPIITRATRWHPDGTLVPLDYAIFPRNMARGINSSNWVCGYSYYTWDLWEAAIWAPDGTCRTLGGLWTHYAGLAEAHDINDADVVVGTSSTDTEFARAFRWTAETGMVDIGTLGGPTAGAYALNNAGDIVGIALNQNLVGRAFLYRGGQMHELGALPGGPSAEALDINELGQIVGGSVTGPTGDGGIDPFHAVLWEPGAGDEPPLPVDLGVPFPGGQSWAAAINNLGQIIGNAEDPGVPGDYTVPWIWEAGVMKLLRDLIPPEPAWNLYQVYDINDNGWIAGCSYGDGDRGFVLIPLLDGDLDYDGDVDGADFTALDLCVQGPDVAFASGCISADIDEDGDADLPDFGRFQQTFGGVR